MNATLSWSEFFAVLQQEEVECDFLIERESGNSRVQDVKAAVEYLDEFDIDDEAED